MEEQTPPSDPLAEAQQHLERAHALQSRGDLDGALHECDAAIRLFPHWARARRLRGEILESLGRTREALEAFRAAAWLDPSLRYVRPGLFPEGTPIPTPPEFATEVAPATGAVPWTNRDAWWGMGLGVLLWITIMICSVLAAATLDMDEALFLSLLLGFGELFLLLPVWWFTVRKYGVRWEVLGFRSFRGSALGIGCGLLIGAYIFTIIYAAVIVDTFGEELGNDISEITEDISSPGMVMTALIIGSVIVAPFVEETFFRGFLFTAFRQRYGWKKGALITAALFSIVHLNLLAIPTLFLLGFALAFLYHRSESLWPPMIMHGLWNGVVIGFSFVGS